MDFLVNSSTEMFYKWGVGFVFVLLLIENIPFIGFLTPAITIMILAGFLSASTEIDLATIIFAAYAGTVFGDNVFYWLGRHARTKINWVDKLIKKAPNAQKLILKYNLFALSFYQFAPYFRMFLPVSFGAIDYPKHRWFIINLLGSFLYVFVYVSIGYTIGKHSSELSSAENFANRFSIVAIFVVTLYLVYVIWKWRVKRDV